MTCIAETYRHLMYYRLPHSLAAIGNVYIVGHSRSEHGASVGPIHAELHHKIPSE